MDGISKETSTKRKWDVTRWNQKAERAIGNREDARSLNYFIETLQTRIANYRTELISNDHTITSQKLIDFVKGQNVSKAKLLEDFEEHNNEILALVRKDEYAMGTYERYCVAKAHVSEFIKYQYRRDDSEFRELNFQFVKNYELYLKTVRNCANNTALKYIANLKTIVLRAIAKEIILRDLFKQFKGKRTKCNKKPLTTSELERIENKVFSSERLTVARDVFIFQCYTGLSYIDAFQLKPSDIREGIDGSLWIMSSRQKSKSTTDIPVLNSPSNRIIRESLMGEHRLILAVRLPHNAFEESGTSVGTDLIVLQRDTRSRSFSPRELSFIETSPTPAGEFRNQFFLHHHNIIHTSSTEGREQYGKPTTLYLH